MDAQQTQPDAMTDFLVWLDKNKNLVLGGVVAIAVAGAGIAFYTWSKNQKEAEANAALLALPSGFVQSRGSAPANGDAFLKVADEYSGTSAAERAELLAAGTFFSNGQYDKAQTAFEKFLSEHPESSLRGQASFGVAASLEALGKPDQALAKYQAVEQQSKGENVAALAALARGRVLEAQNKPDEALKAYATLETGTDVWRTEAIDRREKLLAKNPQLAPKSSASPQDQIIEVTTPPEGSTDAPKVRVLTNLPTETPSTPAPAQP